MGFLFTTLTQPRLSDQFIIRSMVRTFNTGRLEGLPLRWLKDSGNRIRFYSQLLE